MKKWLSENKIRLAKCDRMDENPNMPEWTDADHWKLIYRRENKQLTVYFSQGYGHHGNYPKTENVWETLMQDYHSFKNFRDVQDMADEYGYTELYKARRVWKALEKSARKLDNFLTTEAIENCDPYEN